MRIFCWSDASTAPTGFGRSAEHVLHALHRAGHELTHLAINLDMQTVGSIPWRVIAPTDRANDAYGLRDLAQVIEKCKPDAMWATFDPEVPWAYKVPVAPGAPEIDALHYLLQLRQANPGFRTMGWFPVDGGPLSNFELSVLGMGDAFDVPATMSPHVYDLIEWTLKLRGMQADMDRVRESLRCIPHGVDVSRFTLPTKQQKREAKQRMGMDPDTFLIIQVERNQQRKQNYLALEVMEMLFARKPDLRGKVKLYQHMVPNAETADCNLGFDLYELAWRYGLKVGDDVQWPPGWVSEEDMQRTVYAAADVFISTSTGEGFQYPAWEALACGVPIIVPNDSARSAYFKHTPNAHLYRVDDHRLVMRGGYRRRMSMPDPGALSDALIKMILGKDKYKTKAEAGRVFVERVADLGAVQTAWVDLVGEQEEQLMAERSGAKIAVPANFNEPVARATMLHNPGMGDLVLATPALRAWRTKQHAAGRRVHFRIQRQHLELARILDVADAYELDGRDPRPTANVDVDLHELYHPQHQGDWGSPRVHRTETIAAHLGIERSELERFSAQLPADQVQQAQAQFLELFGVDPTECVAIALESANQHRAMPLAYVNEIAQRIKQRDATPLVLGCKPLNINTVGVIDMTGKTQLGYLITLLEMVGAVITTDTATLHLAGMAGTPMVACFPLMLPESRLGYYHSPVESVTPPDGTTFAGEQYPAGPFTKAGAGEWAASITVDSIMQALDKLLDLDPVAPALVKPEGTK